MASSACPKCGRLMHPESGHETCSHACSDHRIRTLEAKLAEAREAINGLATHISDCAFDEAWALKHSADDHMVTIDHKDEMYLADLVLLVLDAARAAEGGEDD